MYKLRIKLLAFNGAADAVYFNAANRIEKLISTDKYEVVEKDPDVLFFLSGGSEQLAVNHVAPGHFYVLVGSKHDNSYASATEVKAYLNQMNILSLLLDEEDSMTSALLDDFFAVRLALNNLKGKKLGLIGKVSDWLISSSVPAGLLETTFGIQLDVIPWSELSHFSEYEASEAFLASFQHTEGFNLSDTAKVYALLADIVQKWQLDAMTVECFPLVRKDGVTACLPLAKFNDEGLPAGCEGDLTAIAGMMLCKELTGIVPWIANVNKINEEACLFSHCTIALGLVNDFKINTHFETGEGTAIEGDFKGDFATIFRFDQHFRKAFIATSNIIARPQLPTACRTQIEAKLSANDVKILKENPLGNHHLIFPGDCKRQLQLCCTVLGIEVLQ
ncbi:MAG: hypothetical protein H6541_13845 [Lentimicrobiaceae bacterium]|nr:hypothetical protein [Lentimicrobiaceae bacterium]MCO5265857.1 hypothetical protein [Lentimicrobium sp.]HPG33289.1 hypothetical protein [Lentimicrobium sp.]